MVPVSFLFGARSQLTFQLNLIVTHILKLMMQQATCYMRKHCAGDYRLFSFHLNIVQSVMWCMEINTHYTVNVQMETEKSVTLTAAALSCVHWSSNVLV